MMSAWNAMMGIRRGLGLMAVALLVWGCGGDSGGDGDGGGDGDASACEEEQFAPGELPESETACRCVGQQVTDVVAGCTINCFCTSNGWVCTDSCGGTGPLGPELGFASEPGLLLLDDQGNVVDGADPQADGVAPGSRLRLVVELSLVSGPPAEQVEVRILNEPQRVEFRGSRTRTIPRVDSETPGVAEFDFDIRQSATAGPLQIELEARAQGTNTPRRNLTFDVVLSGPVLEWGTLRWLDPQDAQGDPVPFLERGETYNLSGMLRNVGTETATEIGFQVLVDTTQFEVMSTPSVIATLAAGDGVPVDATLRVLPGANQQSTDVTMVASASGGVTTDRIVTASIDVGGGGGTLSLDFGATTISIGSDSGARRAVTVDLGDNSCSPSVADGPAPQSAGSGTFSVEVTNNGTSSADLAWTASSLPTCVPGDFVNPDDADDPDYISPACARGIFGCNAGPDIDQVDGPATLAAGASGTVTVTFTITDVTADRSAVRLEAQSASGTTSRVFDQDGERVER